MFDKLSRLAESSLSLAAARVQLQRRRAHMMNVSNTPHSGHAMASATYTRNFHLYIDRELARTARVHVVSPLLSPCPPLGREGGGLQSMYTEFYKFQ